MAFIHKDQGTISRGKVADLPQGRDVAVHGEGPISGHQAQSMLLQGSHGQVMAGVPSWANPPILYAAWGSKSLPGSGSGTEAGTQALLCWGWNILPLICASLSLAHLFQGSPGQ